MDKQKTIEQLKSLKQVSALTLLQDDEEESIHDRDIEAIETAIDFLEKEIREEFRRSDVNRIVNVIVEKYFSDNPMEYGLRFWEIMEYVKLRYKEDIAGIAI